MASGSCQGCEEEDEESLKKLIVRLNNVQEGKQIETLCQEVFEKFFKNFFEPCKVRVHVAGILFQSLTLLAS